MNVFTWIKEKLGFGEYDFDDIEIDFDGSDNTESLVEALARSSKKRRNINVHDTGSRSQYVRDICEMMSSTSADVDKQKEEYQQVLSKLADLDEIDSLPLADKTLVISKARKIVKIEDEEETYVRPQRKITESQYRKMEQLEEEIPDILKKMKEDEDYQMVVRRDLNLLEGEKGALAYQRKEDRKRLNSAKNWALIAVIAGFLTAILILVLNKSMRIKADVGVSIVAAVFALALTGIFVSFNNAQQGIARANRKLNKTISLQNTVKVKYVNITNVLDYNYSKYGVLNSHELGYMWEKFQEEKAARLHDSDVADRLDTCRRELYTLLKHYHINDPANIIYQPRILTDSRVLEDTRRELNVMRQRLRKGIDFEVYNLENAKAELSDLVKQYPQYGPEIMGIAEEYDG